MAFLIVAAILLVVNAIFLAGSLIYTLKTTNGKLDPRPSNVSYLTNPRMSLQPQVVLYEAMVRMSGNPERHSISSRQSYSQKRESTKH